MKASAATASALVCWSSDQASQPPVIRMEPVLKIKVPWSSQ